LYQKIASATKATVMIHRMMSLLRFFSSAMEEVQHTSNRGSSAALRPLLLQEFLPPSAGVRDARASPPDRPPWCSR
jgi:hypothetical protein